MQQWWGHLVRSSGIVAAVLIFASLVWGFAFSARETGHRLKPAWWLDLHSWLGGLAMAFTGVHLVAVLADHDLGLGVVEVLVPGTAKFQTTAMTWGVAALYLLAVVTFTSWAPAKRRLARRTWHLIHLLSIPAAVAVAVHSYQAGSDRSTAAFQVGLALLVGAAVYPAAIRLIGLIGPQRVNRS